MSTVKVATEAFSPPALPAISFEFSIATVAVPSWSVITVYVPVQLMPLADVISMVNTFSSTAPLCVTVTLPSSLNSSLAVTVIVTVARPTREGETAAVTLGATPSEVMLMTTFAW